MGGSGWHRARKLAVEDGLTLSLAALLDRKALAVGSLTCGTWSWRYPGAEPSASVSYEGHLSNDGEGWLRLRYTTRGQAMDYRVRLVTTQPNYGGRRWCFLCPVSAQRGVEKRSAKLYLPPGATYFGSREVYKLTYQSCRESGQFRGLFARLATEMGTDPATVRAALKRKNFA